MVPPAVRCETWRGSTEAWRVHEAPLLVRHGSPEETIEDRSRSLVLCESGERHGRHEQVVEHLWIGACGLEHELERSIVRSASAAGASLRMSS